MIRRDNPGLASLGTYAYVRGTPELAGSFTASGSR